MKAAVEALHTGIRWRWPYRHTCNLEDRQAVVEGIRECIRALRIIETYQYLHMFAAVTKETEDGKD